MRRKTVARVGSSFKLVTGIQKRTMGHVRTLLFFFSSSFSSNAPFSHFMFRLCFLFQPRIARKCRSRMSRFFLFFPPSRAKNQAKSNSCSVGLPRIRFFRNSHKLKEGSMRFEIPKSKKEKTFDFDSRKKVSGSHR